MRVRLTAQAEARLIAGLAWIARDNPAAAARVLEQVEATLDRLERFSRLGRRVENAPRYRQIGVRPFRLYYRIRLGEVVVITIVHHAQQPRLPRRG